MSIRYQRVGLKVERVVSGAPFVPPPAPLPLLAQRAELDRELVALDAAAGAVLDQARRNRERIRALAADARQREQIRARMAPTRAQVRPAPPEVTPAHLVRARFLAGISQRDLATQLGLHRSQVAEAERGKRYIPERLGRWAIGVLRTTGEWEGPPPVRAREGVPVPSPVAPDTTPTSPDEGGTDGS